MALVVSAGSTIGNLSHFVGQARDRRGGLNYASTGVGTLSHLVMENLKLAAGIEVEHVPYRGNAPALTDLHAGQVQAMFTGTAQAAPLLASGRFRALAVTGHTRALLLPDVPTLAEAGLPGAEVALWAGVMGPAGMPRVVVRQLERAFDEAVLSAEVRDRLRPFGVEPIGQGAKALSEVVARDAALWQRVAQASGTSVD
jgi:tripartite-type tricarboxylate transporter receptor subunit TctC